MGNTADGQLTSAQPTAVNDFLKANEAVREHSTDCGTDPIPATSSACSEQGEACTDTAGSLKLEKKLQQTD